MYSKPATYASLFTALVLLVALFLVRDPYFLIKKNFTTFSEVYSEVSRRYVDEIDPEKLIRHGIKSMLELLDPYTVLLDEADHSGIDLLSTGRYSGVGIEVGARAGKIIVIAPMEGYSAQKRGVRAGDVIEFIDGIKVSDLNVGDIQSLLRGDPGTPITLGIRRYGINEPLLFDLVREQIEIKNIRFASLIDETNKIGYIALERFGQQTAFELRQAILDMSTSGKLNGLILDLRNNPGGLLDEAVKTVDLFVGPGELVVRTQGRSSENNFSSRTNEPVFYGRPLIILQNNGSASSSEIVAGALQDMDRALIIGSRSFGKGLVQTVRPLSYNVLLKITVSKYYIPSGRSIQSVVYDHEQGSAEVVTPEKDRKKFYTKNGRIVYDGEGIDADIKVPDIVPALPETAMMQGNHYIFFVNEYQSDNNAYDAIKLPDSVYQDFLKYLEREKFEFQTPNEKLLAQLESGMGRELANRAEPAFIDLNLLLFTIRDDMMKNAEPGIRSTLHQELLSRYQGPNARILSQLQNDPVFTEAFQRISLPDSLHLLLTNSN